MRNKKIVYVDMDDTICDFTVAYMAARQRVPDQKYPQAQMDFFRKLEPIQGAVAGMNVLHNSGRYDVWILTKPSVLNPLCYTEKRLWVEDHLGIEWCKRLILCPDKGLMRGDFLVDDKLWSDFEGTQILFNKYGSNDWSFVLKYLLEDVKD